MIPTLQLGQFGRGGSRGFPLGLPGIHTWFDAQDSATVSLSGSNVTNWRDKASGFEVSTAWGTVTNLGSINSKTALRFGGAAGLRMVQGSAAITPGSRFQNVGFGWIFAVYKQTTADGSPTARFLHYNSTNSAIGNTRFGLGISITGATANACNGGGRRLDADGGQFLADTTNNSTNVVRAGIVIDWTNSDAWLYRNGSAVVTTTSFQTSGSTTNATSAANDIGSSNGAGFLVGDLGELVAGSGVLTAGDIAALDAYFQARW